MRSLLSKLQQDWPNLGLVLVNELFTNPNHLVYGELTQLVIKKERDYVISRSRTNFMILNNQDTAVKSNGKKDLLNYARR